ncbi:MAG: family 78 glycoside hydrolase catalytic domain, partial [Bacillota bacterium]
MTTFNFENSWICSPKFLHTEPINLAFKECESTRAKPHSAKFYNQHTYFRKSVNIASTQGAVLKITADDYYKLYINGVFVTQGPANSYAHCYNYNTLDISKYLRVGQNTFAVHVHYQGYINRAYNSGDLRQGMVADLLVAETNLFDSEWKCYDTTMYKGRDKVAYHTQFNEKIDNRKSLDWFSPDFDDSAWKAAPKKVVDYTFVPQITPNLAVYKVEPLTVTPIKGGYFIDFGTTVTGTIAFNAHGKCGNRIKVRCGEELNSDGSVRYKMRCSTVYDDVFILKKGANYLEQYEYKCFRYMEVTAKSSVQMSDFSVIVRHYPYKNVLSLKTEHSLIAKTWEICANAVKYCAQEVYVDCPHREKGQYLGDLTVTGHSQMWLTGDTRLFKKAMDDFKQSAFICKGLTAVAPASFVQEIADFSLLYPYQQLLHYNFSGDRDFLQSCLPTVEALVTYFSQFIGENGLLWSVKDKWNLVDWPMNLRDNYDFPLNKVIDDGCHNVINALYVGMIKCVEEIKDILGVPYDSQFARLKQAYIDTFFDTKTGLFVDAIGSKHSSLHANTYAIFFDLAPKTHNIVSHISKKGLSCGVFMSYFVLMGLINIGETETAIALLTNTTSHSWHNMIAEGATTAYEAWGKDQKKNTSLCHSWASA